MIQFDDVLNDSAGHFAVVELTGHVRAFVSNESRPQRLHSKRSTTAPMLKNKL